MLRWVNTETVPVQIEVEQGEPGYFYNGRLLNVPVYTSYTEAMEYMITKLETQLVILKSEQKRNQQAIEVDNERCSCRSI